MSSGGLSWSGGTVMCILWLSLCKFYNIFNFLYFQITVYKIDDKNNLDLDLAILSALLKGNTTITVGHTYLRSV